jgi:hypothetical protein
MQFAVITTIAALAIGSNAAAIKRQGAGDPRLGQFRVYSAAGCSDLNDGFYTVDEDQSNVCNPFNETVPYVSIQLQDLEPAADGCQRKFLSPEQTTGWDL